MNREILTRDRQEADQRYNDALTALDRAIVDSGKHENLGREDFERLTNALIVFLQQITVFVETKDRELAAETAVRVDAIARSIDSVAELRTQVGALQRAVQSLSRNVHPGTLAPGTLAPPSTRHSDQNPLYVAFEDQFRGSAETVSEKLRTYVPVFQSASGPVVDLGCGRGEMLAVLKAAGVNAQGVDANGDMAAIAHERGLDATQGDALAYLQALDDESVGGIVATQVIEHLEPAYLTRLLSTASHKMQRGAPIVLETINPACWLAFFSSYIRDLTHVRPVHPDTLQYLLRASGFSEVTIAYSAPVPAPMKMRTIDIPAEVLTAKDAASIVLQSLAHTLNANATILNSLMFTHMDYAAIGYRS
jgi:2-polyprenyl-3-methyl-5-hydroxy-6-metoxy-1,4-benzoquinol methylase